MTAEAPATDPTPAPRHAVADNYRTGNNFGAYRPGSVLPEWAVLRACNGDRARLAVLVGRGVVTPTHEPVNTDVRTPEPRTSVDLNPAVVEDRNRLEAENQRLASDNKALAARVEALRANLANRDRSLGEQTDAIEHLKAACESHQDARERLEAENAALRADLEAATAPAKGGDPKKADPKK